MEMKYILFSFFLKFCFMHVIIFGPAWHMIYMNEANIKFIMKALTYG